nr:TnsA endonuclease N-terminal domain-containing protein [uncultured Bacillus sp.]
MPKQHEFLSDLERNYFYLLKYSDSIVDIREQFPLLPVEETIVIADELGIKHPTNPKTGESAEMTTDFLVPINNNGQFQHLAGTLKYKEELINERILSYAIKKYYRKKEQLSLRK